MNLVKLIKPDRVSRHRFSWGMLPGWIVRASKADLVHYRFFWSLMDMTGFSNVMIMSSRVTCYSDIVRQKFLEDVYRPLRRWFLNEIDMRAALPNDLAGKAALDSCCDKNEIAAFGLGQSNRHEPSVEVIDKWRQQLGERFFLFAGMTCDSKSLPVLLEAVADTQMPLVIAGDGPEWQALKQQATDVKLTNVRFLDPLPEEDRLALLNLCYGLVFPSRLHNATPDISLLEGAMCSKPMIVSEVVDEAGEGWTYTDIAGDIAGETGLVVPPNDISALRRAMMQLWNQPELAVRMGKFAQKRYQTLFAAEMMAKNYVRLYVDVITGNPKTP